VGSERVSIKKEEGRRRGETGMSEDQLSDVRSQMFDLKAIRLRRGEGRQ
jgi:hypothetical protein